MYIPVISTLLLAVASFTNAQSFLPSGTPLLTRSPYLNAWADTSGKVNRPNNWPTFWSGNHTLGWAGFMRVDDDVYEWNGAAMGDGNLKFTLAAGKQKAAAKFNDLIITPTRTIYVLSAGPIQFNVTFLNPIEPDDLVLQSFPFSYVSVDMISTDNQGHRVQVYSDLSGEWLAFAQNVKMQWDTSTTPIISHSAQLVTPTRLGEDTNMALDGVLYHATNTLNGVTWQTGGHYALRGWFLTQGSLNNTKDPTFRNVNDNYPVLAFAHDVGTVTGPASVVYAIGFSRNPVIKQTSGSGSFDLPPYWTTKYKTVDEGLQAFLGDFDNAKARADKLDDNVKTQAQKISSSYNDLVSLAARQTFAGVETAVGPSNSIFMFMKDVGSTTRVNPVETLYAAFPTFLFVNPTWCRYLLEPLLQYESSSQYTKSYAAPDIGPAYPNAAGEANVNALRSIDDSSAMLIMAWAHARFTGEQVLLNQYYTTLQKWADQIISSNGLNPSGGAQTADGLDMNNMTNLAIKGIIGVRAMAEISHTVGKGDDASKYQNQASSWVTTWQTQASSDGHLTSTYSASNSWGLMYNLYPDKLLGMKLVSQDIYDAQDKFYSNQALSSSKFGLPYDSNAVNVVKSHWTMLTAATTKDISARDYFIKMVRDKVVDTSGFASFPTTYNAQDGKNPSGLASPAQGAAFGLLTLNLQSKLEGLSGNTGENSGKKSNTGAIAGGVVGGLGALAAVVVGALFFMRRKRNNKARDYDEGESKLSSFFGRGGNNYSSHPQTGNPLDDYHVEPVPMPLTHGTSSGYQSQVSYHSPTEAQYPPHFNQGRLSFTSSGSGTTSSAQQAMQLAPLRLHNGESGEAPRQAAPLPRKADLARIHGTPSQEDIARHNAANSGAFPTSPSVGASSDSSQLRNEVENLRREMEEMRARTNYEPPPQYT
ncbi:hypothetical protein V5O48_003625 [Marasmius crinis-equi]|uniref:DUF1793-domain-containing protein n=1 Tax=Marasmius crinis-equi TaxID=585013 RepID=A0ABR3FSE8_9AGAR